MANFANPTVGSAYTSFPTEIRDAVTVALQQLSVGSHSNIPTGAIQFSLSDNRWKKYNGSAFVDLTSTYAFNAQISATQLSLGDSQKILFGASNDLEILHDGFNSVVRELGTGSLFLQSDNNVYLGNAAGSQQYIEASLAQVVIKSGNNEKIKIDSSGAILPDNSQMRFGAGSDLQIYHNGSSSYIDNTTGNLYFRGSDGQMLFRPNNNEDALVLKPNGAVELYYDNSKKLETSSVGAIVNGVVEVNGTGTLNNDELQFSFSAPEGHIKVKNSSGSPAANLKFHTTDTSGTVNNTLKLSHDKKVQIPLDNAKLQLGASQDLELYHDGSHSFLQNTTGLLILQDTSGIYLRTDDLRLQSDGGSETYATLTKNGAVSLNFDNSTKFETTSDGATFSGSALFPDNQRIKVGGDASTPDLQIYHDTSNTYLLNSTGNLILKDLTDAIYLQAPQIIFQDETTGENIAKFISDGAVELYHDNSKKFETTSVGINVSGNTSKFNSSGSTNLVIGSTDAGGAYLVLDGDSNGDAIGGDYAYLVHATDGDLEIHCDNPNGDSRFELYVGNGATQALIAEAAGAVKLYHDNTQRFETVSNGFRLAHSTGNVDFHFNRLIVNAGQTFFIDHTATGADFQIRTSDSSGLDTTALQILGSGCLYNRCRSGSQANLTLRKQLTGADGIDYLQTRNQNNNLRTAIKGNGGISNYQSNDTNLSDETMKKNIVDCESIIEKFKQWKLRKFNYNSDVDGTPLTYGLIAQEIETLHSDLVSADFPVYESGEEVMKKTVKDHQLMMLSFKALQEAIAKIEVLETEVAALKAA